MSATVNNEFYDGETERLLELAKVRYFLSNMHDELLSRGRAEGKRQSIQEGIRQGIQEARTEVAEKMLQKGYPIEEIVEVTELNQQEVEQLKEE